MIIGISGPMHVGKTALATLLEEREAYVRESFANPLKELTDHLRLPATRESYQRMGQGARDLIHPDVWVDALGLRIDPNRDYVIDDVRYPNELAICDVTIRLECSVWTQWSRYQTSDKYDPSISHADWLEYTKDSTEQSLTRYSPYSLLVDTDHMLAEQVLYYVVSELQL